MADIVLEKLRPKNIWSQRGRQTDRQTYLPDRDEGEGVKEGTKKTGML